MEEEIIINYPISVFLDTNIYKSCRYDISENQVLMLLEKLVKQEKIELYISNIVVREVENHIRQDVLNSILYYKKAQKDISKLIASSIIPKTELSLIFNIPDSEKTIEIALNNFKNYLNKCEVKYLDNEGIDISKILDDYFNSNPPFEDNEKKKNEFPDALIIEKLKREFGDYDPLWVISGDNGFKNAMKDIEYINCFSKISELLDMINKQDKLYDLVVKFIMSEENLNLISSILIEQIKSNYIEVDGIDIDRQGVCDGHEYKESIVQEINIEGFQLDSVYKIDDDTIKLSLFCDALLNVCCTYDNYDDAAWDSEEKEFLFVDEEKVYELHEVNFDCYLSICYIQDNNETTFAIKSIDYDISLDQYTRIERF